MQPGVEDMTNVRYLMDLARVHLQYNALSRAEELLRKAQPLAKEKEDKAQVGFQLASLLQRKQDFKGATALLEETVGQTSNTSLRNQYTMTLSDIYLQGGEPDKAEKVLTDLLESASGAKAKPEDAWIRTTVNQRLLSVWQRQEGKVEKMRTATEELLAKDPQNRDLLERLSYLYTAQKPDYAKAIGVYQKLLELAPNDRRFVLGLATAYQENKQYDKAIEVHQKFYAADPKVAGMSSVYQIAQLYLQAGKKDEAVKWAKEHLAGETTSSYGGTMLINFFEQAGMIPEAMEALAKLRDQAQQPQQKADHSLHMADLARKIRDYKKAEEEIQKVLKDFPDDKSITARANGALARLKAEQANPPAPKAPVAPAPPTPPAK